MSRDRNTQAIVVSQSGLSGEGQGVVEKADQLYQGQASVGLLELMETESRSIKQAVGRNPTLGHKSHQQSAVGNG